MTEEEWLACNSPSWMLHKAIVPTLGVKGPQDRQFDLLGVAFARFLWTVLSDDVKAAVEWREATAGRRLDGDSEACKVHYRNVTNAADSQGSPGQIGAYIAQAAWRRKFSVAQNHLADHFSKGSQGCPSSRLASTVRDIFGNPFRPVALDPLWLTFDVQALARGIYDDKAFDRMPILADALQDAGCDNADVLNHCRSEGPHVRGCWVLDMLLEKA